MSDDQDGFKASFKDSEGVNAALHLCIADRDEEIAALRARVAKLEAALREARGWVVNFDNADNYQRGATLARIDAALKGTPQ